MTSLLEPPQIQSTGASKRGQNCTPTRGHCAYVRARGRRRCFGTVGPSYCCYWSRLHTSRTLAQGMQKPQQELSYTNISGSKSQLLKARKDVLSKHVGGNFILNEMSLDTFSEDECSCASDYNPQPYGPLIVIVPWDFSRRPARQARPSLFSLIPWAFHF